METILYECGICNCYHPWDWNGDCRNDENRINSPKEFAEKIGVNPLDIDVRTMEERIETEEQ